MYTLTFSKAALKSIAAYKKSNPKAFKKVTSLLAELQEHPRTGTGHPEPLTGGNDITWSREITKKDRLVYDIYDAEVNIDVLSAEGHYKDK